MKKIFTIIACTGLLLSCNSGDNTEDSSPEMDSEATVTEEVNEELTEIDSDEALIATALMAAPAESREGCKVIGYNMAGEFVTLKEGDNEFICLADDPQKEGFSAACYHISLEPFMARGRELKAEGKTAEEKFNIREEEVKAGTLEMGKPGSALHIYFGTEALYNPETSMVNGASYRYVVYIPWATSESTGLPEVPIAPNHPWIMNPGSHKAHIMITPSTE
ncbi:MAG: hypothetical protein QNK23_07960 [Crocinitomicaceae bacterium]|nr:hypothetical protein [Crocinitomicaceae bacterium]